jgi:4-hydroxy-2-oxoheptanedioate aldolase
MSINEMKARWARQEVAFGAWCISGSPFLAETLALEGFHYVCLDMQHGLIGYETFLSCIQALARTPTTPVVRVPDVAGGLIGKVLDAGAEAIIVPMVETKAEAERAVAACRYYPEGNRSFGSIRGIRTLGRDPTVVNREVACLVMIETAKGVANAEQICSVPGLDGVYVGPGDLALTLGLAPTLVPQPGRHADAIATIREACQAAGIAAGIQCHSGDQAQQRADEGFTMITVCGDTHLVRSGAQAELAKVGAGVAGDSGGTYT